MRRKILEWTVSLVALWAAVISGLAFSIAESSPQAPRPGRDLISKSASSWTIKPGPVIPTSPYRGLHHGGATARLLHGPISEFAAMSATTHSKPELLIPSQCPTPMSLMLHSSFGPIRMWKLAREIVARGIQTTTYRRVAEDLEHGVCPKAGSLIVSMDDFGTDWLRPRFQSTIDTFTDRNLVLVVGAVVHGPQDPEAWAYLRDLEDRGVEVASHTIDHHNLARLEPDQIEQELRGSYEIICRNLGTCPQTLILPFGSIDAEGRVRSAAEDYSFIVGINGGHTFGGEAPFYLGRIGPDNFDQRETLRALDTTFNSDDSSIARLELLRLFVGHRCTVAPPRMASAPHFNCQRSPK